MVRQSNAAPEKRAGVAWSEASTTSGSATPKRTQTALSIVVPTRNEAGNIAQLVQRVEHALPNVALEIVFVDDSDDDTVAAIEAVRAHAQCDIHVIHREPAQRTGGLGSAVVEGLRTATAPWVCVMDADLQHPPELLPRLFNETMQRDVDVIVASRYCGEGDASSFNRLRSLVSHVSTSVARLMFPRRLGGVTDPMSGFFLVRKAALDLDQLRPRGFKILLEILVRTPGLRRTEVPFQFGKRHAGESKASLREGFRYLLLLCSLRFSGAWLHFTRFLLVGASGIVVNLLLQAAGTDIGGMNYLVSAVLATQGSTLWNFGLTEFWVFGERQQKHGRIPRLCMFFVMNNAAFLLRGPIMYVLTSRLGVYYLVSNFISLMVLTVLRYALADKLIWKEARQMKDRPASYSYDIHGIITVTSDVWLPELERFLIEDSIARPTIRVRIGNVKQARRVVDHASGTRRISYHEGLGRLGFGAEIVIGDHVDVLASPLLRRSPHVLYTNVVEPILRWTFVQKGYALVHCACIADGDRAYFITARTDTGKTTTMLRILARQRRATDRVTFLSDDLTLLGRDGRVLTYPKPLTISHHTVRAINSALLSKKERWVLPFQSRIHSRSGRRFAFFLTQTKLPVATINTIVQLLVPPPKYHVQRLVPNVKVRREAKLAGLFVIERGGDGNVQLHEQEAFEILMSNCEDAYGFPPYPTIKGFLHNANGQDLRSVEREIVAQALHGKPAMLLRSSKMDWAQRIPALVRETSVPEERGLIERHVGAATMPLELTTM